MDQKLAKRFILLKEEAESARRSAASEVSDIIADITALSADLVDERDVSFVVAAVFDEDSGVLSAVETMLPARDKAAVKAKESCLTFLANFVSRIGKRAFSYASFVKVKCISIFRRDDSRTVQAAALTPLLSILELSMQESVALDFSLDWTCAESLLVEYRKAKTAGTLRSNILMLIGYGVEKFPNLFQEGHLDIILKVCLDTLEEELHRTGSSPVYILVTGAIKCLDSLLVRFDNMMGAGGSVENARKIYVYLEQVIHFREDLKRYEMVKAGLRLLSRHASLFRLRLLENFIVIIKWLQSYCTHNNPQLRDVAFPAFEQFITEIVSCIASDLRVENPQQIYKRIFQDALGILDSTGTDPKLTSLAILTVGKLSPLIVKFSGKESLLQTFYRLVPFGGSSPRDNNGREESLKFSVTLVGAFADMVVYLDDIENYMVSLIAKAVGSTFHGFPYLFPKQRRVLYRSLQRLLKALYSRDAVFTVFLTNIVWSSLDRAMEQVNEKELGAVFWKHYVGLWSQLLAFSPTDSVETIYGNVKDAELQASIFDCLLRSIMKAVTELNLKYRVKSLHVQPSENSARESDLETEPWGSEGEVEFIEPLDPIQMRKFLNLVEFVQDFLSGDFTNLFLKWVYPFGRFLVELSSQYPLISGFYKLLSITIHKAEERGYFGRLNSSSITKPVGSVKETGKLAEDIVVDRLVLQQDRYLCKILFSKYLQEVLVSSRRYKLELLASCLRLCLSAPPALMDIESLVGPTINALKIGLRHFPLATVAMDFLEKWHQLHPRKLEPCLPHIVPYFNAYLVQSDSREMNLISSSSNTYGAKRVSSSGTHRKYARVKDMRESEIQMGSFQHVQLRIEKFLGKIGGQSHLLVPDIDLLQVSGVGGLAWDTVNQVRFNLPFRDIKPDIWLDSLLLRIVEVSTASSDRQAKIVASELLHAICLVMLGNAAKGPVHRKGQEHQSVHYEKIYRRLFPAILRLATDMELVTRQLFTVFMKQLIHWFTSNTQKENPDSMALIDSILDGVVDTENGSLREFCAECFAEFMRWSVRHTSAEVDNFVNIASMLRRLYTRLDHPNPYHRLGAAMAAHLIYPVLRENGSIVDCHILEFLFFSIKSLRIGDSDDDQIGTIKQIGKVLEGIQRLIRRNITSLQKNRKDRKMFLNIQNFLDWLFSQTCRSEEKCRKKCMWLFSSMCEVLPVGSSANWFNSKFQNIEDVKSVLKSFDIRLRFPELNSEQFTIEMLEIWMKEFVCCLDWFQWALKEQLISLNNMVMETGQEIISIGSAVNIFLQNSYSEDRDLDLLTPLTPSQKESLGCLRVKTIVHLFNFLEVMLYVELGIKEQDIQVSQEWTNLKMEKESRIHRFVPFNEPHFQNLMFQVIFHPQKIAFSSLESQIMEDLMKQSVKIIKILSSASPSFKQTFMHSLRSTLSERKIELNLNIFSGSEHADIRDTMHVLKGFRQLHLAGALLPALGKENAKSTGQKLLNSLLSLEQPCTPALQPVALESLTLAIQLGVTATQLLELVLGQTTLHQTVNDKSQEITSGSRFYFNFRNIIVQQIKFSYKECLPVLLEAAVQNFTARLVLIAVLDDYLQRESITNSSFLREIVKSIQLLKPCCNPEATLSDKLFFLEILQKLFMLDMSCDTVLAENQQSSCFIIESYFLFFNNSHLVPDFGVNQLLQRNTVMTVKSNALLLTPYFFTYSIDNDVIFHLIDALTKVVTDHLLVQETDIPQGSNERVAYIQMLQRLEDAILVANKLELLEVVFPLFQSHVKIARKKAQEIVESYADVVGENRGIACVHCLKMLNDFDKTSSLRRAVFDYMFIPMISRASDDFIVDWYEEHIGEFNQIFNRRPERIQDRMEIEQDYLVVRICHYKMVELLFSRLDAKIIKDRITPIVSNQILMQHATSDSRAKNDPAAFPFPENVILWRELHIAAYNCLAEIVMRTQDQEKLYAVLFKDFPGKPLWQNIVDCSKVYNNFPVETSMLQTSYLTLKSMRSERSKRSGGDFSLSSQYVGATLTEEPVLISTFLNDSHKGTGDEANAEAADSDRSEAVAESSQAKDIEAIQNNGEETVEKESIDRDDFDQHPSMGTILKLIEHCQRKFGVRSPDAGMPEWMKSLYASFHNVVSPINVCLFIAKIITKARKVFASFSATWFQPYVQVILRDPDHSGGRTFHYMLRDICITILDWNLTVPPDVQVASGFVNHLVSVAAHPSKLVVQANLEIIKLYMQTWKDLISLNRRTVAHYLAIGGGNPNLNDKSIGIKRSIGLQLLGAMAAADISLCSSSDGFTLSEDDLCRALLLNVKFKLKNVYKGAAELIGIVLKHTEEGKLNIKEHMLLSPLKQTLLLLFKDGDPGQFLNIIDKITLYFPQVLDTYAPMVLDLLAHVHGVFRVTALDILLRRIDSIPNLFNTVAPFLSKLVTHRDEIAQFKSLQLVAELVKDLNNSKIEEKVLPVLCETFSAHENIDCRQAYFNILIFLYKEKGMDKNKLLRHHLLLGLIDDSEEVKHNLQTFWHSELSQDLCPRFIQMVNHVYDPDMEECWAQITIKLLLKLCEESVDFERPVFNAPLSACEFHEYTINTSWLGGTLPMTPLFSETQLSNLNSQDSAMQNSEGVYGKGSIKSQNIIRATYVHSQSQFLSKTQSSLPGDIEAGGSFLVESQHDARHSIGTLKNEGGALVDKDTGLKRRILHPSTASSQAKINALNALRKRQSRLAQQSLERANKVQMMRKYRIGELPDIEIAHKDVVIPLSVLAEKDGVFARLFLIVLCHSINSLQSNGLKKAEHELKLSVREGIEEALQRTRNGVSFVGCAMDLCLEIKESWLQPKLVGSASQNSRNFHTGILFLEKAILHEAPPVQVQDGSRKRHCGSNRRVNDGDVLVEAWLELVKLYKSIGEHDIVLSIYKNSLTKAAITRDALEAQLRGDSNKALQLYDNALNQFEGSNPTEGIDLTSVEQDIWYNQRLQSLGDLNRWQDIMEDTLFQIRNETLEEQDFQRLWSPGIQNPYLGLFIKGSVKLTTYSSLLSEFIQATLEYPTKRELLHDEFSVELATLAVINDQFDLAKFYIQKAYDSFRRQWSSIHPLATVSRHLRVRQLQRIIDLDEFVELMAKTNIRVQLESLLALWRDRWPSTHFDDVESWDDIVQNRLMYIQKSQGLVRKHEADEILGRELAADLDSERAHIFFQAARGLMKQGSYDAAQGYMNQYMAAVEGSSKKEKLDFKFFRGLVKLRCLQADRESTVNAYEAMKMLQQVHEYVASTAEKQKYRTQTQWITGLKLLKGDVTSQLAQISLKILPIDHGSVGGVGNCIALVSSAYTEYSGLLEEVETVGKHEKDALFSSKRLAKIFLKFAFFCDELLASTKYAQWGNEVKSKIKEGNPSTGLPHSSVYPSSIVRYILKAVQLDNSMQVQHGIARVLTMLGHYKETHSEFISQMKGTPCWLFIAWIPQMLAVVDRDEGGILVGLLEQIAQSYPQSLFFPYNVSKADFGTMGKERTRRLEILLDNPIMKGFTRALEDLTFPEQRLRNALVHLKNLVSVGDNKGAQRAFHDMFVDCLDVRSMLDDNRRSGEYNLKFARDYSKRIQKALGENGSKLKSMDERHFNEAIKDVMINLMNSQKNLQVGKISLSSLSKWMSDFDGSHLSIYDREEYNKKVIEVPGSYSSFKKPESVSHVKLMSFDQTLLSLGSKQRPKILKMRGADEKDYKFVVKGGEDLRLDQRIEQLFDVMNTVLLKDSSCARRKLSLRTYAVIPISKQCGVMQFVEDTTVLEDVIKNGLAHRLSSTGQQVSSQGMNTPMNLLSRLRIQYQEWIEKKGGSKNLSECYTSMYKKVGADEVTQKMNAMISQLPWDALKTGISRLSTSAESFLALRSQFVRSLSVLSICGYIAGVGDRHLSNSLVDTKNGMLVPIDFGYSFGTGVILLPVPELIPFRLTTQFTNLLLPLDSTGLLRNDMVRTLSALHANREIISAVLDVFVNEPLVDWKNEAMKTATIQQPEVSEGTSGSQPHQVSSHEQQHVALKIENAHRKLNLWNPADVTISELHSSIHSGRSYLSDLEKIVRGNPQCSVRARIKRSVCESVQEQVDCLIDQATDFNLLGRIWVGWQPWV